MMDRDLSRTTLESFLLSIASLRRTDLRPRLKEIKIPCLGVYGAKDIIVHPLQWRPMQAGIESVRIEHYPMAGHFMMLEEPADFSRRLKAFLDEEAPAA
jgi:pimeloyl-ACP methyl ester carboxylesterase